MSRPSRQNLSTNSRPWLFAATLSCLAPHLLYLPPGISSLSLLYLGLAVGLWRSKRQLPARWLVFAAALLSVAVIAAQYRSLFGREPGIALCSLLITLKLLELRERRDALIILFLSYFLVLTYFFQAQDIPTMAWSLCALTSALATQIQLHHPEEEHIGTFILSATRIMAQALPMTLLLFFLFPRIPGPLWSLPDDADKAQTGLSDTLSPGHISELVQNGEIAFRARFAEQQPLPQQLYWRGPVLETFSDDTWQASPKTENAPKIESKSAPLPYEMILEAHQRQWLLALDAPLDLPEAAQLNANLTSLLRLPLKQRQRFHLRATLDYRFNVQETPAILQRNLHLPPASNPRTRALAAQWRGQPGTEIVRQALRYFADGGFIYTLRPPRLNGNAIDDFLFDQRRGFCEHYASAFAFMMRSAGVPTRIVTGYQGGEWNPQDHYLVVRQSDAHAWTEVWLEKQGWVRIDPTSVVSTRIDQGISQALARGEPLPFSLQASWLRNLRHHWEALNNRWNQAVLGYDAAAQQQLIKSLSSYHLDWGSLIQPMILGGAGTLLLLFAWLRRPRRNVDPLIHLWQKALAELRRSKVDFAPWETPLALAQRVDQDAPWLAEDFRAVVAAYLANRYADDTDYQRLRLAVAQLCSRRKKS